MKKAYFLFAFALSGLGLLASFSKSNSLTEITLDKAISQGLIHCNSNGAGGYSGKCVSLELRNKTNSNYKIAIPEGTLFYPHDPGQQTLITIEPQFVLLGPAASKTESVNAYCSEHSDRSPGTSTYFSIGKNKNPKFDSLFVFLKNRKIASSQQDVVWAISDNSPISSIGNDTKTLRDLRKYLCKLTGQEEVDYAIEQETIINDRGFITHKPLMLKGFLTFNVNEKKWVHQEVYDENGKLKWKSQQAFDIPKGESDYTFHISVKNWEPGKYTLKLKQSSEVVQDYTFKI